MALKRYGSRVQVTGETNVRFQSWSDTVSVLLATNAEGTAFAKVIEVDAYGNVRLTGQTIQQAQIQ